MASPLGRILQHTLQVLIWDPEAVEVIGSVVRYHVHGLRWIGIVDVDYNVIGFTPEDDRIVNKVHRLGDNWLNWDTLRALSCLSKGLELILQSLHPITSADLPH